MVFFNFLKYCAIITQELDLKSAAAGLTERSIQMKDFLFELPSLCLEEVRKKAKPVCLQLFVEHAGGFVMV